MKLLFPFILLIFGMFYIQVKKSTARLQSRNKEFWDRESKSNSVPAKNIDNLDYIIIPYEKLPFIENSSKKISEYQQNILALNNCRILNLNGMSNTDVKLNYGTINLPKLSEYDENYTRLVNIADRWSAALIEEGYSDYAVLLLEALIDAGCITSRMYLTLAGLYKEKGINKIDSLIIRASASQYVMKDSLINKLKSL